MDKRTKKLAILFGIAYVVIVINFSFQLYKVWGLVAALLLSSVLIVLPIIIILIRRKLNGYFWYKEVTDRQYGIFLNAYNTYKNEVMNKNISYERFVDDFQNSNQFIYPPTDSRGNVLINKLNKESSYIRKVFDILHCHKDLVEEYFQKDTFGYSDYIALNNRFDISERKLGDGESNQVSLEDVKKQVLVCYEENGKKSDGDRLFGYYLISRGYFSLSLKQCQEKWNEYIGIEGPCDSGRYIKDPSDYGGKNSNIKATIEALYRVRNFFEVYTNYEIISIIDKDIKLLA